MRRGAAADALGMISRLACHGAVLNQQVLGAGWVLVGILLDWRGNRLRLCDWRRRSRFGRTRFRMAARQNTDRQNLAKSLVKMNQPHLNTATDIRQKSIASFGSIRYFDAFLCALWD